MKKNKTVHELFCLKVNGS